ncbi:PINIT domain-containing protein [Jimgerdemannia flammicorona]|uniref:PINIT domain-containing protein n=1 Tax=Jimgerdemannia flammicorona TaxID=994334 RepID=A0A433QM95_9FUNG|nr:PINIT domain-containing protein [Jimgerdemannia flammicorona]
MEEFRALHDRVLPTLTVNQLKSCIRTLNNRLNAGVKVSGNKPELIDRIREFLVEKRDENNEQAFGVARDVIYSSGGQRPPSQYRPPSNTAVAVAAAAAAATATSNPAPVPVIVPRVRLNVAPNGNSQRNPSSGHSAASPSSVTASPHQHKIAVSPAIAPAHSSSSPSHHHHHHHHHHHNHNHGQHSSNARSSLASSTSWWDRVKYKSSPFYDEIEKVVPPKICPGKEWISKRCLYSIHINHSNMTTIPYYHPLLFLSHHTSPDARESRFTVTFDITLNDDQLNKLRASLNMPDGTRYQLRFFCCWAETQSYQNGSPAPGTLIEYPQICELKVNNTPLSANLRGLKNKPGTVNPPDITPLCRMDRSVNKVEFVYANTSKRYLAAIQLVKRNTVESIVEKIKSNKFVTREEVLKKMRQRNEDSEIEVGSSMVSLKCPLGHMRINLPCRSSFCNHIQCFDAYTFFNMNEQTPTWTCPVCSRVMKSWDEIVVDGYFSDMLARAPRDQDSVVIESDGEWHLPKPVPAVASSSRHSTPVKKAPPSKSALSSASKSSPPNKSGTHSNSNLPDIMVIEGDNSGNEDGMGEEDDDNSQSRSRTASATPGSATKKRVMEVIDLTLESEDEEDDDLPPPPRKSTNAQNRRVLSEEVSAIKVEKGLDEMGSSSIRTPPEAIPVVNSSPIPGLPVIRPSSAVAINVSSRDGETANRQGYDDSRNSRRVPGIRVESLDPDPGSMRPHLSPGRPSTSPLYPNYANNSPLYNKPNGHSSAHDRASKRKRSVSVEDEAADSHSAASALLGLNHHRHHGQPYHYSTYSSDPRSLTPNGSPGPALSSLTLNDDRVSPLSNTSSHSVSPPLPISLPPFSSTSFSDVSRSSWEYRSNPIGMSVAQIPGSRSSSPYRTPAPSLPPITTSQPLSRAPSSSSFSSFSLPPLMTATAGGEEDFSPTLAPLAGMMGSDGSNDNRNRSSSFPLFNGETIHPYKHDHATNAIGRLEREIGRSSEPIDRSRSHGMSLSNILEGDQRKVGRDIYGVRHDQDVVMVMVGDNTDRLGAMRSSVRLDGADEDIRMVDARDQTPTRGWRSEMNASRTAEMGDNQHNRRMALDSARLTSLLLSPPPPFALNFGDQSEEDDRDAAAVSRANGGYESMSGADSDPDESYSTAPETLPYAAATDTHPDIRTNRVMYPSQRSDQAVAALGVSTTRSDLNDDDDDESEEAVDRRAGKGGHSGDDTGRDQTWPTQVVAG